MVKDNGLSLDELRNLWYKSISKGVYNDGSKYSDVRSNILKSANELKFSAEKISVIEEAFDRVGIGGYKANLTGKITDAATGAPLSGVTVSVYANTAPVVTASPGADVNKAGFLSRLLCMMRTFATNACRASLSKGTYTVTFSKAGYSPYTVEVSIDGANGVELDVAMSAAGGGDVVIDEAHFPDEFFRESVRRFDTDGDGVLSAAEIAAVTEIYATEYRITSLQGIEYFTALQSLSCQYTNLTKLDVSKNTALAELHCYDNQLTTLDVSGCTALGGLHCDNNQLTTLDLSNCPSLGDSYFSCDPGVTVIRSTSSTSASSSSSAASLTHTAFPSREVLAVLQPFTPKYSGTFSFTASLDHTPPEGSSLLLLDDSQDLHASFSFTESPNVVHLSADITAGRLYSPVIAASHHSDTSSGGCSSGLFSALSLAVTLALIKRH